MKCKYCGEEIVDGHVYCDHCGREVQFVPDFNLFEEEVLPSLVGEKDEQTSGKNNSSRRNNALRWLWHKKPLLILFALLATVICFVINSYDFACWMGVSAQDRQDYAAAAEYFKKAVQRKASVESYLNLGNSYFSLGEYSKAESEYKNALSLGENRNQDVTAVYESLLTLYTELNNVSAMEELYRSISDVNVLDRLQKQFVQPPSFSVEEGNYNDTVKLKLSSNEPDCAIYYTLDDSEPEINNGQPFKKKIRIKEGETTVKAICIDSDGNRSPVVSKSYAVTYDIPSMPVATPSSGNFHTPVQVTLTSESEGSIYYSWNGQVPSRKSYKYTGPISIPEGNNVLSAVVINKHEKTSEVLRCNYVYLP